MKNFINRALAAKKKIFSFLCALSALFFLPVSTHANTVTVDGETGLTSTYLPVALHTNISNANYAFHSVSQQLYYASELAGASSNKITAISFDYVGTTMNDRKIAVWMNSTSLTSFPLPNEDNLDDVANKTPNMVDPGMRVFSGTVAMVDGSSYTITFDTPYMWDGTSNIIVTVLDSTAKKNSKTYYGEDAKIYTVAVRIFETPGAIRFLHKTSKDQSDYANKGWDMDDLPAATANSYSVDNRKYANRITFTFAAASVVPSIPEDLAASPSVTSASLSWTAVDGATSYKLAYSTDGSIFSELATPTSNSYEWTGLTAASTYYVKVAAVNAVGNSDWSEGISFTTEAVHSHNGINFEKWNSTSSLPTSGNYYLANDVELSAGISLSGNLNLCLNGHNVYTFVYNIVVPDGKKLAIYDNVGGGQIYGYYIGDNGSYYGLISIAAGGELVLGEGAVRNLAEPEEEGEISYGIYNNGTFKLSGEPVIEGTDASIFLLTSKVITIESGKPLTNSTPYSVNSTGQVFTSGWENMGGAHPSLFFTSRKSGYSGVSLVDSEAKLVPAVNLSDAVDNSSVIEDGTNQGVAIVVNMTRSLTSAQYNTFCLPFALSDAQLQTYFGSDYDLEEFTGASIVGDVLELEFTQRNALEAGKPYLLKPSVNVSNPTFDAVVITAAAETPSSSTSSEIDFIGVYSPTSLEGGNHNLLFLGADNELFWPASTGNLKGFRAYFEVKGSAAKAAKHARIVKNESQTQAIDNIESTNTAQKRIIDGQLIIEKNGTLFNACGQRVK